MQHISREDLQALLDAGTVTLIEALPEPHYDAEHLPGAGHCSGGTGPTPTDPLAAVVAWVEHGHAPDTLPAAMTNAYRRKITSNLCRYPQTAHSSTPGTLHRPATPDCR